jgi:membrane-bound lytic murein transglycosylase A
MKENRFVFIVITAVVLNTMIAGCAPRITKPAKEYAMERISSFSYPKFLDDLEYNGLEFGITQSLSYLYKIPPDRDFVFGQDRYDTNHMIRSLEFFLEYIRQKPTTRELEKFIQTHFLVYRSIGRDQLGEVLFTGYYEPHLKGSLRQSAEFHYPIYARPQDLITVDLSLFSEKYKGEKINGRFYQQTVVPYYDRSEIDYKGAIVDKADVLAWVKDPIDIFFLQIQGSGKVYLDNGEVINVHYHTTNGRPYRSIGTLLIKENKIPAQEMSMQKIRSYLNEHPHEMESVFNYNPSYVFFKIEAEGPLGNINVKLTPGRSIALDRQIFPPAALAFIETQKPLLNGTGSIDNWTDCTRFALNQDTGGAIKGAGRADIFWGNGIYAEMAAGHLKHPGKMYFLVLKPES